MANDKNEIIDKIQFFRIEIEKSTLPNDLLKQQHNLEKVYDQIVSYLGNILQNADEHSRLIEMQVASLEYIKQKHFNPPLIKNTDKKREFYEKNIAEIKSELLLRLSSLKKYVIEENIIFKAS